MKMSVAFAAPIVCLLGTGFAFAQSTQIGTDKYRITAEEMSACSTDAISLCSYAYPDEEKLLGCMKLNRVNLSSTCRPVFDAGIRRRHL